MPKTLPDVETTLKSVSGINPTEPQVKAGGYLRISSDPNDKRQGVTRQRADVSALCEVKGWQIAGFYVDNDRSASSGKDRPEWDRLLADIAAGKVDAIAAWDQDRGWRMMAELEQLRRFFTGLGRHVPLATTGQGDIDLYSPTGVLAAQIKTAVSEHEIAMMRVRQRRAARQKAEQGRPQWRRAFGYLDTPAGPVPDPEVAPLVRDAYKAVQAGASLKDVARMWNDAGALTQSWRKQRDDDGQIVNDPDTGKPVLICTRRPWTESQVSAFLRKARNAGLRAHGGEIVGKGTWEPLVEEPLWRAVQATMDTRAGSILGTRRSARVHLLTGMILCRKCGGKLAGQWVKRRTGGKPGRPKAGQVKEPHPGTLRWSITYACKGCHGLTIRAEDVEPLLVKAVGRRLAREDASDLLKAEVHDAAEAERIRGEKAVLYGELDTFAVERAEGLMTARQVQIASEIVQRKIDALDAAEQDQERLRVFDGIPLGTPAAVGAVEALSPDRFRAAMRLLMTVTIEPVGRGNQRVFDPRRVTIDWFMP